MTTPWATARQTTTSPPERPWMGMAIMAAVPVLSLVLIRLFWSGSSLWFLTVGIILLGAAAIVFLARRTGEQQYGTQTLAAENSRVPLVLAGLGVLFLAMLVLPNFAGGDSSPDIASPSTNLQSDTSQDAASDVAGVSDLPDADTPRRVVQEDTAGTDSDSIGTTDTTDTIGTGDGTTYIVQDGDTLWDISLQFDVSVEALVEANGLEDETSISIDQELVIPASDASTTGSGE